MIFCTVKEKSVEKKLYYEQIPTYNIHIIFNSLKSVPT